MLDEIRTFSIALLVRAPGIPLLAFLPLGADAPISDAVSHTAKARASIIAFLASLLAVRACVLDLSTLRGNKMRRYWGLRRGYRINVHGH